MGRSLLGLVGRVTSRRGRREEPHKDRTRSVLSTLLTTTTNDERYKAGANRARIWALGTFRPADFELKGKRSSSLQTGAFFAGTTKKKSPVLCFSCHLRREWP